MNTNQKGHYFSKRLSCAAGYMDRLLTYICRPTLRFRRNSSLTFFDSTWAGTAVVASLAGIFFLWRRQYLEIVTLAVVVLGGAGLTAIPFEEGASHSHL